MMIDTGWTWVWCDVTSMWERMDAYIKAYLGILGTPISPIINITYTTLQTQITTGTLIPGQQYKIIDFQTIHAVRNLVNVANTGPIESIVVLALDATTLADQAWSLDFPEDTLWYNATQTEVVPTIFNKGVIYKRVNNTRNLKFLPTD